MKAIIENIQRFSLHDGPGTRTTIFFKGCPLTCLWCSNPTTQSFQKELLFKNDICHFCGQCEKTCPNNAILMQKNADGKILPVIDKEKCQCCGACTLTCRAQALEVAGNEYDVEDVFQIIRQDIMFYQNSGGGVTFSGGEMLSFAPFVSEIIDKCRKINIHTCAETSGYGKYEHLKELTQKLKMLYFDIKHINEEKHKEITGVSNKLILENLNKLLEETNTPIYLRLPLIPTVNDDDEHLIAYAKYVNSLPKIANLELLPYHRLGSAKYNMLGREYTLQEIAPSSPELLKEKVELMRTHAPRITIQCTG